VSLGEYANNTLFLLLVAMFSCEILLLNCGLHFFNTASCQKAAGNKDGEALKSKGPPYLKEQKFIKVVYIYIYYITKLLVRQIIF
jgi:hypothetical protein